MNKTDEGVLTEPFDTTPIEVEQDGSPFIIVWLGVGFLLCVGLGVAALLLWGM